MNNRSPLPDRKRNRTLWAIAMLLASALFVGAVTYLGDTRQAIDLTTANLDSVARLKSQQVENWLSERNADAAMLQHSHDFSVALQRLGQSADVASRQLIEERIAHMISPQGFESVSVVSPSGEVLIGSGSTRLEADRLQAHLREASSTRRFSMIEPYKGATGVIHLDFIVPIVNVGKPEGPLVGIAVLHVDPAKFLFPLVQSWPTSSASGETLLVRQEGNDVLFLNQLRHQEGAALSLKHPASDLALPAAAAVRSDKAGTISGVDYRGVKVLAAFLPVPGTSWRIVTKLDRHEVLADSRKLGLTIAIVALFAAACLVLGWFLLQRQSRFAEQLAMELQASRLTRYFYDLPFIGMAISSGDGKRLLEVNEQLCRMLGYTRTQLTERGFAGITNPANLPAEWALVQEMIDGKSEGYRLEKQFIKSDGTNLDATVDIRCVRKADRSIDYFLGTIEDLTARKAAEARAVRQKHLYTGLSQCNAAMAGSTTEGELFARICAVAVEASGLKLAWIGLVDGASKVVPVASAGDAIGYLNGIEVSIDSNEISGTGPTGTAIRSNTAQWCNDLLNDPATQRWHARAHKFGVAASAALPILRDGKPIGALNLYAADTQAFDAEVQQLLTDLAAGIGFALNRLSAIANYSAAEAQLGEYIRQLQNAFMRTVEVATTISEMRDPYTAGHEKRVAEVAVAIAREMGLDAQRIEGLRVGGFLHDIGKITIPAEILSKPGKLSAAEFELIKGHSRAGFDVLKNVDFPWPVAQIALQHHERLDGSGYPQGLKGDQIILEARILAVADVIESMSSHRPYRASLGMDLALAEIERGRGSLYDPAAVDACCRLVREQHFKISD